MRLIQKLRQCLRNLPTQKLGMDLSKIATLDPALESARDPALFRGLIAIGKRRIKLVLTLPLQFTTICSGKHVLWVASSYLIFNNNQNLFMIILDNKTLLTMEDIVFREVLYFKRATRAP